MWYDIHLLRFVSGEIDDNNQPANFTSFTPSVVGQHAIKSVYPQFNCTHQIDMSMRIHSAASRMLNKSRWANYYIHAHHPFKNFCVISRYFEN